MITALLNWYAEPPTWLADCVASVARFCHHIVAVDGAYAAFPGALRAPSSDSLQAETILHTAHGAGIGCTLYVPREPWWGNEVGKRDRMWQLGQQTEAEWLFSIDADEAVTAVPFDLTARLEATEADVAEIGLTEDGGGVQPLRRLFRRLPEMHVEQTHYTVTALKDGRRVALSGNHSVHDLEVPFSLTDLRVEHRNQYRDAARKADKARYYATVPPMENDALAPIGEPRESMREAMERRGLSFRDLAFLTGQSASYLCRVASGERHPSPDVANRIARAFERQEALV